MRRLENATRPPERRLLRRGTAGVLPARSGRPLACRRGRRLAARSRSILPTSANAFENAYARSLGQDARLYGSPEGRRYLNAAFLCGHPQPAAIEELEDFIFRGADFPRIAHEIGRHRGGYQEWRD